MAVFYTEYRLKVLLRAGLYVGSVAALGRHGRVTHIELLLLK